MLFFGIVQCYNRIRLSVLIVIKEVGMRPFIHLYCSMVFTALFFLARMDAYPNDEICELVFESCPEHFDGDTIDVPAHVMALSTKIRACDILEVEEGITDTVLPSSIFFIIDESGSMWMWHNNLNEPPRDSLGSRFLVTSAILDTLLATNPKTHVGLALFGTYLMFDPQDDDVFVEPAGYETYNSESVNRGAYIPLLQLDSLYTEYQNRTGFEILQYYLRTKWQHSDFPITIQPQGYRTENLLYQATTADLRTTATNITTGFDAAKDAMSNSPHQKEDQFVIFLSDGEANQPSNDHPTRDRFITGENVPTTFTIFFSPYEQAPQQLYTMTENIRNNNYSPTNTSGDIWTIQTSFDDLMGLLFDEIISPYINVVTGNPYRLEINRLVSSPAGNRDFIFAQRYALQADVTELNIDISYIVTDTRTGTSTPLETESTLYLRRTEQATAPFGFSISCWDRTSLQLQHQGVPVNVIREDMNKLEILFFESSESFPYIVVDITNSQGEVLDFEQIDLHNHHNGIWSATFSREISTHPVHGDGTIQHQLTDTIMITWRNPSIPLDTIQLAAPFNVSRTVGATAASYHDRRGDGFVDSVYLALSNPIAYADLQRFALNLTLPEYRNLRIDSVFVAPGGVGLHVEESGTAVPRTFVTSDDIATVNETLLPEGGLLTSSRVDIQDRIAPVITHARLKAGTALVDTLTVTFSEPPEHLHFERPFLFSNSQGQQYTVHLQFEEVQESVAKFSIIAVEGAEAIYAGDSIWIYQLAGISDHLNNVQSNPLNRRVVLEVRVSPHYDMVTRVINSPYTPGQSVIPHYIQNIDPKGRNCGLVVIVKPMQTLRPNIQLQGIASVYDVAKNPIIENDVMFYDPQTQRLYFFWDARNRRGREVATGTYTVTMQITDNQDNGKKKNFSTRIGVRR